MRKSAVAAAITLVATLWCGTALADPPAHAPAHGWRKKNDPGYVGYTGTKWSRDYDVASGRCNREEIGAVLGAAVGAAVGSRASDEHRTVATILGAAVGGLIGARIGRELDDSDRACFGHVLEIGQAGRAVAWTNPRTGVSYTLVPEAGGKRDGRPCRNFVLSAARDGQKERKTGTACQAGAGEWRII
jgi:surface antigen